MISFGTVVDGEQRIAHNFDQRHLALLDPKKVGCAVSTDRQGTRSEIE